MEWDSEGCYLRRAMDVSRLEDVAPTVLREVRSGDLVVTMGAGSVWEVSRDVAERLRAFERQVIAPQ